MTLVEKDRTEAMGLPKNPLFAIEEAFDRWRVPIAAATARMRQHLTLPREALQSLFPHSSSIDGGLDSTTDALTNHPALFWVTDRPEEFFISSRYTHTTSLRAALAMMGGEELIGSHFLDRETAFNLD